MKKHYFTVFLCSFIVTANAQFRAGQKLLGPSLTIGASTNTSDMSASTGVFYQERKVKNFNVGVGFSLIKMKTESIGFGWGVNYGYSHYTDDATVTGTPPQTTSVKQYSHIVGASFFRRKFYTLNQRFNFFYDMGIGANGAWGKNDAVNAATPSQVTHLNNSSYGANIYATPGFTYSIKKNILLEASLKDILSIEYLYTKSVQDFSLSSQHNEATSSTFGLNSTLSANGLLNNITFSVKWIL